MSDRTNEDFFDISSSTPRIPHHQPPPCQKMNPAENSGNQHVFAPYNIAGQKNNGYENLDGEADNGNVFEGRHLGKPESALPISERYVCWLLFCYTVNNVDVTRY